MSLYPITSGSIPQASDVQQLNNIFNGTHDIGQVNLAPTVTTPTTTGFSFATQSGGSLGVGTYQYVFTYVTGQYKTDGVTIQITGETLASSSLSVTTTSANKTVAVTLPNPGPVSIIATRIYRTAVGGSTYGLIATVKDGVTSYTDNTADGSRGAAPPTTNSTGTTIGVQNPYCFVQSSSAVNIGSANTIIQLPINSGIVPRSFGVTLQNNSMLMQQSGVYCVDALIDLSGLNNNHEADITIRVVRADATYYDNTHYIEGWQGLGTNASLGAIPITHSMMLTLTAGDQVQVFARCDEAPRNVNNYYLRLWKISN